MNDEQIENEIKEKGLNAPRVTPEQIDNLIIDERYYIFPGTTVTVACLTLRNGFNVIGESASASLKNFDEELGRKIARQHAYDKIWALEGYVLRNSMIAEKEAAFNSRKDAE